jgi:Zn-dependent protease
MLNGSLKLGRWAGISVSLHWSVVLIAVLLGTGLSRTLGWVVASIGIIAFLGSILAHEFSHALVARRFGIGTQSIELWALGGMARLEREAPTPRAEGWIAAAGPLASLAVGLLALGIWLAIGVNGLALDSADNVLTLLGWLGLINLVLAVFNMLPGAPLDGGRVVRAIRWSRHGDRYRATRESARAGGALGWVMAGGGLWMLVNGYPGIFVMITGLFIALNAKAEYLGSFLIERLGKFAVADITWFGLATVEATTDVETLLWQRERLGPIEMAVVVDAAGQPIGIVTEDQLWSVPEEHRPQRPVSEAMAALDQVPKAQLTDSLAEVAGRLNLAQPLLTVWEGDRILGAVPTQILKERLRLAEQALQKR